MEKLSKETVVIFGDPADPAVQECAARITAAGRKVTISMDTPPPYSIPLDEFRVIKKAEVIHKPKPS